MKEVDLARQRLLGADDVPGLLSAGWDAYEVVMAIAAANADKSAGMCPAFTFARGSAVSGRNAIAFAPSMPACYAAPPATPAPVTGDVHEVADALAGLASALSARLREAAGRAGNAGDRGACQDAAGHAGQIRNLLARGG